VVAFIYGSLEFHQTKAAERTVLIKMQNESIRNQLISVRAIVQKFAFGNRKWSARIKQSNNQT
jgi:hypothetical protein